LYEKLSLPTIGAPRVRRPACPCVGIDDRARSPRTKKKKPLRSRSRAEERRASERKPERRPSRGCGRTPLTDRVQFHPKIRTKKLQRYRNGAERLRLPEWVKDRRLRRLARAFGPRSARWMSEASFSTASFSAVVLSCGMVAVFVGHVERSDPHPRGDAIENSPTVRIKKQPRRDSGSPISCLIV
jgi:hypothetical protein